MISLINKIINSILDLIMPSLCIYCKQRVQGHITLCFQCWGRLIHVHALDKVGVVLFHSLAKELVHQLKYEDNTKVAKFMAKVIVANLEISCDLICAVPIHQNRLRVRKYNQSVLIASYVSILIKKPFIPDLLKKVKDTPSQILLSAQTRKQNNRGAYILNYKYQNLVTDKDILIIDDVITTGATLKECIKVLKNHNCNSVRAATFTQVLTTN